MKKGWNMLLNLFEGRRYMSEFAFNRQYVSVIRKTKSCSRFTRSLEESFDAALRYNTRYNTQS